MTSTGGRIPAWRRLGLALRNEGQSARPVDELSAARGEEGRDVARDAARDASEHTQDNLKSSAEPAVNGKSSKLGKRKHQVDPAEKEPDQKPKKSKTRDADNNTNNKNNSSISSTHGLAGHEAPAPTQSDNTPEATTAQSTPAADSSQPKGDPNYRKKKAKEPKRRKQDRHVADVDAAPAPSPDEQSQGRKGPTLLASTEDHHTGLPPFLTPQKPIKKSRGKENSGSPTQVERRKSVAFTPDTKTSDGNSGQELFKKWVAEQKGTGAVSAPPPVSDFTLHSLIAEEEKTARRNGQLSKPQSNRAEEAPRYELSAPVSKSETQPESEDKPNTSSATKPVASKGKKKDPSVYIAYLAQYHSDRENWKFNKAKQNDVVDNALNIFRIPNEHAEALLEYVAGLKGAGVIERLQERCNTVLKDLDEQDAKMDDAEARKVAQEEAEQERIAKERKRRKVDGDVEALSTHPHSDGYIRRLQRKRAEALLTALGRTAPILPAHTQTNAINPMLSKIAPQRDSKKRKRRGEVSSDESSSDSSSEDGSSSSESDSDSDDSDSAHSNSDEDSDDSSSDSSSDDESNSDSDSDSGSDDE